MQREDFDFSFTFILSYSTFLLGDLIFINFIINSKMKATNQQTLNIVRYIITGVGVLTIIIAVTVNSI